MICFTVEGVVCVSIPSQTNTAQLRNQVYRQLNLDQIVDEEKVVFKLRDFNGALVPLSHQLESNDKDWYILLLIQLESLLNNDFDILHL